MSGGDIAGLIAAGVFAVLVALLAVPIVKLGRVFDSASDAIKEASNGIAPLLEETTTTIVLPAGSVASVDGDGNYHVTLAASH